MTTSKSNWVNRNYDAEMESALDSPHASDRQLGAFGLFGRTHDNVMPRLRALLEDPSAEVRDSAGQTLGSAGDNASLARLILLLDSSRPRETPGIAWAVAELGLRQESDRAVAHSALERWRKRGRGFSRTHADALLRGFGRD